jgi:hypothetical protein
LKVGGNAFNLLNRKAHDMKTVVVIMEKKPKDMQTYECFKER